MTNILTKTKNNILKIGSIFASAVFIFLFGHNAHASVIFDINQLSANTNRENWQLIGQNFVASSTDLTGVSVYGGGGDFYADFYLCKGKVNNAGEVYTKRNCGTDEFIDGKNCFVSGSSGTSSQCTFSLSHKMIPGADYYFTMYQPTPTSIRRVAYQSSGNPYSAGNYFYINSSATTTGVYEETKDIYFRTFYDNTVPFCLIDITTPTTGQILATLDQWEMFYNCSGFSNLYIGVKYGQSSGAYTDFTYSSALSGNSLAYAIQQLFPLPYGQIFTKAYIYNNGTSTILAESPEINFTMSTGTQSTIGLPILDCGTICDFYSTSTTITSGMICAIETAMCWAIYPGESAINNLTSSYEGLKTKFPFDTYIGIMDTVETAMATSTNMNGTLPVPMIRKTATSSEYYMLPVLSSSSIPNLVGNTNATNIRNGISWFMWIMFVAWVGIMSFYFFKI